MFSYLIRNEVGEEAISQKIEGVKA